MVLDARATASRTAVVPDARANTFAARPTLQSIDRLIQEKIGDRGVTQAPSRAEVQRQQNVDMLIIGQQQDQLSGESTRYAPMRDSL
jgi:hypothetical protein